MFGPLLEPFGAGFPPWNPADAESAATVLEHFVTLMEQLHLLYDAYLPPGSENLVTLFWRYYAEKIAILTHGGSHIHQIIVSYLKNFGDFLCIVCRLLLKLLVDDHFCMSVQSPCPFEFSSLLEEVVSLI